MRRILEALLLAIVVAVLIAGITFAVAHLNSDQAEHFLH